MGGVEDSCVDDLYWGSFCPSADLVNAFAGLSFVPLFVADLGPRGAFKRQVAANGKHQLVVARNVAGAYANRTDVEETACAFVVVYRGVATDNGEAFSLGVVEHRVAAGEGVHAVVHEADVTG